jgi:excisionase family DNA binding protein
MGQIDFSKKAPPNGIGRTSMQEQSLSSDFMIINEVSGYLQLKVSTVYKLVEEKKIPHYRIGGQIRFKKSDIDQWMERQREEIVDVKVEANKIIRSLEKGPAQDVDGIVKKAIEEAKGKGYTSEHGKPDRIKGLRKEVKHGSL